jgi:hypothetical protein
MRQIESLGVGSAGQRNKPQLMFCVSVNFGYTCLRSFFLGSEDVRNLGLGAIRNFSQQVESPSRTLDLLTLNP